MIFDKGINGVSGPAANVVALAAPGAGLSLYLQTITTDSGTATAVAKFHISGGAFIAFLDISAANSTTSITYPGGFKLPANTALLVDVVNFAIEWTITYTIGPA